jgi:hypothetical protein
MPPLPLLLSTLPPLLLLKPLLALLFLDAPQGGGLSGFPFPIGKGQRCWQLLPPLWQLPLWQRLRLPPPHCNTQGWTPVASKTPVMTATTVSLCRVATPHSHLSWIMFIVGCLISLPIAKRTSEDNVQSSLFTTMRIMIESIVEKRTYLLGLASQADKAIVFFRRSADDLQHACQRYPPKDSRKDDKIQKCQAHG